MLDINKYPTEVNIDRVPEATRQRDFTTITAVTVVNIKIV